MNSISNKQISQTQSESDVHDSKLRLLAESDSLLDPQDWPTLNKHIQTKLKSSIAEFPPNPIPKLHPQAANQIKNQQNRRENPTSTSTTNQENKPSIDDQKDSTEAATTSLNSRFVPASSTEVPEESTTSQNQPSTSNSSSDSREKSSLQDYEIPLNPKNPSTTFHIPGLAPIESSMFFASKRQPGKERNHMWSKTMTKEEIEKEVEDLCLVLDGFRDSPPFTIQRLSELILKPELYHTPTKYLSSIRRVLSVTAERGSFPIPTSTSTIQPPNSNSTPLNSNGINPNGILSSSLHSENSSSQAFHPNSLFQSTSSKSNGIGVGVEGGSPRIPYTRNNDPIFSPIPFLVKDSLKKDGDGEEEEIPKIELGESRGAQEEKENQVEKVVEDGNQPLEESEKVESNQNGEIKMETDSTATRPNDSIPTATNTNDVPSIDSSASTTTDATIPTHNTPLGVPLGRIDELDDLPKVSLPPTSSENSTSDENKSDQNNDSNAGSSGRGKLNSDSEIRPISSTTTVSSVHHGDREREIKRMKSNSSIKVESEPETSGSISGSGSTSVEAATSLDGDSEMKDGGVKVESTSQKENLEHEGEQEKEKEVEKKNEVITDGEVTQSEEKGKDEMDTS